MNKQKSRFEGLFEPAGNQPEQPVAEPRGNMEVINQEIKKSRKEASPIQRIKTNYEIRPDYARALKRIAVDESRKIYEVLEEAIAEYLERREESKK